MGWRVARSLDMLLHQIDARFPGRSRASDGSIGDSAHASTGSDSDHNPWYGPGIVTARDYTHDPSVGFDIDKFTDELAATRDPRIKYIIANGWILDSRPQFSPWKWVRYDGSNPHTHHAHVSVMATPSCDDARAWNVPMLGGAPQPAPQPAPVPSGAPPFPLPRDHWFGDWRGPAEQHGGYYPNERDWVRQIQRALIRKGYVPGVTDPNSSWADSRWDPPTTEAMIRFQRAEMPGTTYFGQCWWDDWARLLG